MNKYDIKKMNGILTKDLLQSAIVLESEEMAWDYNNSKIAIDVLRKNKCVILGGDVYQLIDRNYEFLGDNWYIDTKEIVLNSDTYEKRLEELSNYSADISLEYINKYESMNNGKYYYCIVIADSSSIIL